MAPDVPEKEPWALRHAPWLLGLLAGLAVLLTLGDPGITSDEPIDVKVGRNYLRLVEAYGDRVGRLGPGAIGRAELDALFEDNRQHPPLGRWLLGIASAAFEPVEGLLGGADPISVHAARIAPMAAFALLVGLVAAEGARRFGRAAGVAAGVSLVLMPRVFAHAHLATLDTFLSLFWTVALLGAARAIDARRPVLGAGAAGVLWGLALLTKIHAWFLPPLVVGYAIARLPICRAIPAVGLWGAVGLLTFLLGWPWLWHDTAARLAGFLATGTERLSLKVLYFGEVMADREVPWHYPWFYFLATVPIGLHALGLLGLVRGARRGRSDPFPALLAGSIGLFLVLFSTGVPVYDGERLFVHVFPAWALLIGLGFGTLWERARRPWWRAALVALLMVQGVGVVRLHPLQLSYYNATVGGLPGAERKGLELTYWGDTIDRHLLDEAARVVPPGSTIALVPTLHHLQPTALLTPALLERDIKIVSDGGRPGADWVLIYRREAYWPRAIGADRRRRRVVARNERSGVWLGALWRLDRPPSGPPAFRADDREDSFRTN